MLVFSQTIMALAPRGAPLLRRFAAAAAAAQAALKPQPVVEVRRRAVELVERDARTEKES